MHPKVQRAIEEIDAAVFNGDAFADQKARDALIDTMRSWSREMLTGGEGAAIFALYKKHVVARASEVDPDNGFHWEGVALGFFLGLGLDVQEAVTLARSAWEVES
jgi:hypothetical protein